MPNNNMTEGECSHAINDIIKARDFYRNAKENLTFAVLLLQKEGHFNEAIKATKEVIGDLCCSVQMIEQFLEKRVK